MIARQSATSRRLPKIVFQHISLNRPGILDSAFLLRKAFIFSIQFKNRSRRDYATCRSDAKIPINDDLTNF